MERGDLDEKMCALVCDYVNDKDMSPDEGFARALDQVTAAWARKRARDDVHWQKAIEGIEDWTGITGHLKDEDENYGPVRADVVSAAIKEATRLWHSGHRPPTWVLPSTEDGVLLEFKVGKSYSRVVIDSACGVSRQEFFDGKMVPGTDKVTDEAVYWDCVEHAEGLVHTSIDEAVEDYLDELLMDDIPGELTVYGYKHMEVRVQGVHSPLEQLLENLDEGFGNPDGNPDGGTADATPGMSAAEAVFIAAVIAEYKPWACERCDKITIDAREWVKENKAAVGMTNEEITKRDGTTAVFWDCDQYSQDLVHTGIDEAVGAHLDEINRPSTAHLTAPYLLLPRRLAVYGFRRVPVTDGPLEDRKGRRFTSLGTVLESLDRDYGTCLTETEPTETMLKAEQVFLEAVRSEYVPYRCEKYSRVTINAQEWARRNRAHWINNLLAKGGRP